MSDLSKKIRDGITIAAIGGGSLFTGSQMNRPDCDFIFVNDYKEEICLTTEQAEFITNNLKGRNTGFGGSQFSEIKIEKK